VLISTITKHQAIGKAMMSYQRVVFYLEKRPKIKSELRNETVAIELRILTEGTEKGHTCDP
jgi:hypothetical protein